MSERNPTPRDPGWQGSRKVHVSDRANSRIHVFDENGKFLDAWPHMRRYWLLMSKDQHLWVTDGIRQEVLKYGLTGKLLYAWGTFGPFPGGFWGEHQFHVDSEGSLYTAAVRVRRPQEFRPKRAPTPRRWSGRRKRDRSVCSPAAPCACLGRRGSFPRRSLKPH